MALRRERRFRKSLLGAGTLMADETYPSRSVQCWFQKGPGFSAFSFCLPSWPFVWFQRKCWLVDCASTVHATGCLCCPLALIDVASSEGSFQSVFLSFPRCPLVRIRPVDNSPKSTIFGRRWTSILETCPAQRNCALMSTHADAGNISHFKDIDAPMDV